jgi:DNA-binding PucR family transcriptional regulator
MVLERAATAAHAVLDRTRGRAPTQTDEAAVEVLIDESAPPEARRHAARSLGLPESGLARAVALEGGGARIAPAAAAPWMLSTLYAVATNASLRAAATALRVHHSTLQDRIVHAERLLGWPVREPRGQFRLHLALVLHRLRHHPAESGT